MAEPTALHQTLESNGTIDHDSSINGSTLPLKTAITSTSTHTPENPTCDGSTNPILTPFLFPPSNYKPPIPPTLTPDQQTKYTTLLTTAKSWTVLPTTSKSPTPTAPITDTERFWLTRECLLRYLRATKWNLAQATTRVQGTLVWRREYGVEGFTPEYISHENETGKQVQLGFDINGRPCLYLNPAKQNTERSEKQIQHLVFMMERTIDLMPPGVENLAMLCNMKQGAGKQPSPGQGRQVLGILQTHYPERLGRALVHNVPWVEKMKFDEDLRKLVPPGQLLKSYGGDVEFEYRHEAYWKAFNELAEKRHKERWERWVQGGKNVGESENYLRGGVEVSVGAGAEAIKETADANAKA
ncbi:CRAL-TRIO domain-containing protein C23B6.04c [Physcia stellaris]|nr:CRAL-TRIO domain-containing protein C23B6.04c [Physcia stellaris]